MSSGKAVITLHVPFAFAERLKVLAAADKRSLNTYIMRKLGYDEGINYEEVNQRSLTSRQNLAARQEALSEGTERSPLPEGIRQAGEGGNEGQGLNPQYAEKISRNKDGDFSTNEALP